jgi:hypothetical protein
MRTKHFLVVLIYFLIILVKKGFQENHHYKIIWRQFISKNN